jgi:2-polyprenyl-3-methyl-5-hydroxy-6-metoxy-1,4-benzoquinol methylase
MSPALHPPAADVEAMHDERDKSQQETAIETRWRERLLSAATSEDFQQAYDELHALFLQEQGGSARLYDKVNPRGMDCARRAVRVKVGHGQRLLEVGCGDGETSRLVARQGNAVVSIDVSHVALQAAQKLAAGEALDVHYRYGDARALQFPEASFDYVLSEHFVEHLSTPDLLQHLAEVRRVLKPRGEYLIVTPSRLWNGRCSVGFHLHVYTLEELYRVVEQAGLQAAWVEPRFLRRTGVLLQVRRPWVWLAFAWERLLDAVRIYRWPQSIRSRVVPSVIVSARRVVGRE